jgi:cyclopropane fatty-acyl-phospholipid synthase-like methyltransferase
MGFYDEIETVQEYFKLAEGYDGKELIELLSQWIHPGMTLLEIGMGPGKDLDLLKEKYSVTGSDLSDVFLQLYKKKNETADLLKLDAVLIDTDRTFDVIYSNKVLHHLAGDRLQTSFENQHRVLNPNGIAFHSFWKGDKEGEFGGEKFYYYELDSVMDLFNNYFELLELKVYTKMENDDSFYVIVRKR